MGFLFLFICLGWFAVCVFGEVNGRKMVRKSGISYQIQKISVIGC